MPTIIERIHGLIMMKHASLFQTEIILVDCGHYLLLVIGTIHYSILESDQSSTNDVYCQQMDEMNVKLSYDRDFLIEKLQCHFMTMPGHMLQG